MEFVVMRVPVADVVIKQILAVGLSRSEIRPPHAALPFRRETPHECQPDRSGKVRESEILQATRQAQSAGGLR